VLFYSASRAAQSATVSALIESTCFGWRITLSDRTTLEGLTQFSAMADRAASQVTEQRPHRGTVGFEGAFCDNQIQAARKSLIPKVEMSEWSIEHAWKATAVRNTERHRRTSLRIHSTTYLPTTLTQCASINLHVYRGSEAHLSQLYHNPPIHLAFAVAARSPAQRSAA
jgi:hypothetical protein